jgi:hypothetical protein
VVVVVVDMRTKYGPGFRAAPCMNCHDSTNSQNVTASERNAECARSEPRQSRDICAHPPIMRSTAPRKININNSTAPAALLLGCCAQLVGNLLFLRLSPD